MVLSIVLNGSNEGVSSLNEISIKSIKRNSTSFICKLEGHVHVTFASALILPCRKDTIINFKLSSSNVNQYLQLESTLQILLKASDQVSEYADDFHSVSYVKDHGKVLKCHLKSGVSGISGVRGSHFSDLTLRLIAVRLGPIVNDLVWEFVSIEKSLDQQQGLVAKADVRMRSGCLIESDDDVESDCESDCVGSIGDVIQELTADLLNNLENKINKLDAEKERLSGYVNQLKQQPVPSIGLIEHISEIL